jgi:hypothetical protein
MTRALVPEDLDLHPAAERRAFHRAITAQALGVLRRSDPARILKGAWPNDRTAAMALQAITTRAASPPTMTTDVPMLQVEAVRVLPLLAPQSAALQLFSRAISLDLTGVATIRVPNVATILPAKFVSEAGPGPVQQFTVGSAVLGPVRKILILGATTTELETASPESASAIIARLLAVSAGKGIDAIALGNAAGDDTQPAGLFYGVTPIAPAPGGNAPLENLATDIGNIAAAFANAGIDPNGMVIIASTKQAVTLKLLAGPKFDYAIISSTVLPDRTIAAFAPGGIAAAFEGQPQIDTSRELAMHFEDTTPLPIVDGGTPAGPTRSMFQQDCIAIRVRDYLTWTVAGPGAVQRINLVNW